MATSWVDQITGNGETVAYKAPCRVATTADVPLAGLLTVDGVALAADDRVLVKEQADASQNGIYIASSGIWQRARDFDSNRDVTKGTRVNVTDGATNAGREYVLTSANPINVGVSAIILTETLSSDAGGSAVAAAASAAAALVSEQNASAAAIATAADRVQTGLDRIATGADRTQTGIDAAATAADRVQTGLDRALATSSASLAAQWANKPVDEEVTPGLFSAFHWAQKAMAVVVGNIGAAIHGLASKAAPHDNDELVIADSQASWAAKRLTWANVKTALASTFVGLTGVQQITGLKRFTSNLTSIGQASGAGTFIEAFASSTNAAGIAFHRSGNHAVYFGLDTDNELKFGGWSRGDNAYKMWHEANFDPADYLPTAGGVVAGNLRLNGGLGIGMDPPIVGGLYFYRQNGNPFIVFLGDAGSTGTPVQLGQLRAEQAANVIRLTNAALQDLVSFNLTSRLGTVAGDPTVPLGIATKQYVDSLTASIPGVYVGSDKDETVFPVGHIVGAVSGADPNRNGSGDVRIATGDTDYTIGGAGAQLAGTWRMRGRVATSNKIMQRTA